MEAEIVALAGTCATSLVALALQDLWGWGRKRFAAILGRGAARRVAAAEAELDRLRRDLLAARRTGDEDAAAELEETLAQRFEALLAEHPEVEPRLRETVAAAIDRIPEPVAFANIIHYVNNVSVFQAMNAHWDRCTASGRTTAMFLCGLPGVGKRTAARCWLRSHQDVLDDEVLQADLSPDEQGRPADLAAILERWLVQLGVPKEDRPADLDAKAALVRRRTRDRPVTVLLENVTGLAPVKPLLVDSSANVVLMTGQYVPAGLDTLLDCEAVEVAPLKDEHALDLLVKVSRTTEHPDRLLPIARRLGGLPLALRIIAGHLKTPAPGALEDLTALLADRTTRQELLAVDAAQSVPGALDVTYGRLGPEAQEVYRRLGVLPRVGFQLDTVHALTADLDPSAVRRGFRELISARLVEREAVDTYRLHPLVHDHASGLAEREEPGAGRAVVHGWIVVHYRDAAEYFEAALSSRWRYDPMRVYAGLAGPVPGQGAQAERALSRRRGALLAAVRLAHALGRHTDTWRLCQGLWTFYLRTGSHAEWIESHELGLASALACDDRLAAARMHYQLGFAHLDRWSRAEDDPTRARRQFDAALTLVRRPAADRDEGERRTESSVSEGLALLELRLGRPDRALDLFDAAEAALGDLAHPRGRALLAYHKAAACTALSRYDDAEDLLRTARERFQALGGGTDIRMNVGKTWLRCAQNRLSRGRTGAAIEALDAAVTAMATSGSPYFRAVVHLLRGDTRRDAGDVERAVGDWQAAGSLFEEAGSDRAAEVARRLEQSGVTGHSVGGDLDQP